MLDLMGVLVTVGGALLVMVLVMCWCCVVVSAKAERAADRQMAEWARQRDWHAREDDPEGRV
jgi:hypothetical protein